VEGLRGTSVAVAVEVAKAAERDGVAEALPEGPLEDAVRAAMWHPEYRPVREV
jgi:malate dehydrogenase (oxaloacetate-decarboxylating)